MRLTTKKDELSWIEIGDAEVLVTPMSGIEVAKIQKRHTTQKYKRGKEVEKLDSAAFARDLYRTVIKDWRNVLDEDGVSLECTPDNIDVVVDLNSDFASEVLEKAQNLAQYRKENTEKNSGNGENGGLDSQ